MPTKSTLPTHTDRGTRITKGDDNEVFDYPTGRCASSGAPWPDPCAQELDARGLSANALALKLRVPADRLTEIIRGQRAISAETALRLGRYFGTGAAIPDESAEQLRTCARRAGTRRADQPGGRRGVAVTSPGAGSHTAIRQSASPPAASEPRPAPCS